MTKINIVENARRITQGSVIKIHRIAIGKHHYYILARLLADTYTLINLDDGERWANKPLVCTSNDLTIEAIEKYTEKKISIVKEITISVS